MSYTPRHCSIALACLFAAAVTLTPPAFCQTSADPAAIRKALGELRSLPDSQRGPRTGELAHQIAALPAGKDKLALASGLTGLATEGDPGRASMQAVSDALSQALIETPAPSKPVAGKPDVPSRPYMQIAQLVRFEGTTIPKELAETEDYKRAVAKLTADDADVAKANFTLKDLTGKKWTLSELRGKIVMVNFWATWCPPCRLEFPDLDAIEAHFASQGLVILALTDEDGFKVTSMLRGSKPHFDILLDEGHKVADQFHVTGIPRTYVFDRDGKLVAEAVDRRTQREFLAMLGKAGLHN